MYLRFYNLKKEPFHVTPDPAFLYLSPSHKEALAAIVYGIEQRKGFMRVVGEVGSGKTTILRYALRRIQRNDLNFIHILTPDLPFEELLGVILEQLGQTCESAELSARTQRVQEALIAEYSNGRAVVLIVDEAQNMPVETLERLRMLSNLETDRDKLIQIVLVGQPELDEKLRRRELRQLRQRIVLRATLRPLTKDESAAYIRHRLAVASLTDAPDPIFTPAAIRRIVRRSAGNPRLINSLCENALIAGFGLQRRPIDAALARETIADYDGAEPRPAWWSAFVAPFAAALILVGLCGAVAWQRVHRPDAPAAPAVSPVVAVSDAVGPPAPENEFSNPIAPIPGEERYLP